MLPTPIPPIDCSVLKKLIREVPDFPKKGILFYDITTLLKDKTGFARLIDALSANYIGKEIDLVLGMEARGFIFGPALAYRLNAGFVPCASRANFPPKPRRSATTSNTAATLLRSTRTPLSERPARADRRRFACNRRNRRRHRGTCERPRRAKSPGWRLSWNWTF